MCGYAEEPRAGGFTLIYHCLSRCCVKALGTDARGNEDVVRLGDNSMPIVMCVAALDCLECSLYSAKEATEHT